MDVCNDCGEKGEGFTRIDIDYKDAPPVFFCPKCQKRLKEGVHRIIDRAEKRAKSIRRFRAVLDKALAGVKTPYTIPIKGRK